MERRIKRGERLSLSTEVYRSSRVIVNECFDLYDNDIALVSNTIIFILISLSYRTAS